MERTFVQSCNNLKKIVKKESNFFFTFKIHPRVRFWLLSTFLRFDIQILQSKTKILLSHVSSLTDRSDFKKKQKMPIFCCNEFFVTIKMKFERKTVIKMKVRFCKKKIIITVQVLWSWSLTFQIQFKTKQTSMEVLQF